MEAKGESTDESLTDLGVGGTEREGVVEEPIEDLRFLPRAADNVAAWLVLLGGAC